MPDNPTFMDLGPILTPDSVRDGFPIRPDPLFIGN